MVGPVRGQPLEVNCGIGEGVLGANEALKVGIYVLDDKG